MKNDFESFYHERIGSFGATARGMGWKDDEAQQIRFEQLVKIIDKDLLFTINDLGCGAGDLVDFLHRKCLSFEYDGYDVMTEMITLGHQRFGDRENVRFALISEPGEMKLNDYTIASGIFNIRFAVSDEDWLKYVINTLAAMNEKSARGFAFNMLTRYSDITHMKGELYYGDPCFLFDYCKKNYSKNVALLHDYNQYDFTILVRKN